MPEGAFSGPSCGWRRTLSRVIAGLNRALLCSPPGRALRAHVERAIDVEERVLQLPSAAPALHTLRLAWISDLHAGHVLGEDELARLLARVAALEPELVCLGGDLINTDPREAELLRRPLRELSAPLGVWAVPGNHDYFCGPELAGWTDALEDSGVRVLHNAGARIERAGARFWLAGVDDLIEGRPDLERALEGRAEGEPVLLLAHNPDFFHESGSAGIELTLSGHTHAGQIRVGGWSPMVHSELGFVEGVYSDGDARLFVGRGVGVTVLPFRWGTRGEVALLELAAPGPQSSPV